MPDHVRLPASAAHVFVDALAQPQLSDADLHHLGRVLRLRDGEAVTASDGSGGWRACRFQGESLAVDGPILRTAPPEPELTVAFAVVKGDRPEWTVQKLTELGIDRIVPVLADRGVVRWDAERAAKNVERLRSVARAAAMQSRRVWLPRVDDLVPSSALSLAFPGIALAHPGGRRPNLQRPAIAVGPEGGWSPAELERCGETVDLGPTTLRAETAAVTAGALLAALRSGLVDAFPGKNHVEW
jgi:16S rRNA (uracil1498-N3)-methyltransferase